MSVVTQENKLFVLELARTWQTRTFAVQYIRVNILEPAFQYWRLSVGSLSPSLIYSTDEDLEQARIIENIIEAWRSSTQSAFYICNYSTKSNLCCTRLLQALVAGIEGIDLMMKQEEDQ